MKEYKRCKKSRQINTKKKRRKKNEIRKEREQETKESM